MVSQGSHNTVPAKRAGSFMIEAWREQSYSTVLALVIYHLAVLTRGRRE